MGRFDQDQRGRSDWTGWEKNRAHRYAIEHDGRRYPVKQIVSMATGMPVSEFSSGQAAGDANQYVASRGFGMVELRRRNPDWMRDELILALDMYLRHGGNVDDPDTQFYENYSPRTPNPEPCFVCAKQIGSGSQQTLSWRKADSNHRSRSYERVRLVSPNRNDQLAPRITLRSSRGTAMAARPLGGRSVHGGTNGLRSALLDSGAHHARLHTDALCFSPSRSSRTCPSGPDQTAAP
jgi:hypothetical protein